MKNSSGVRDQAGAAARQVRPRDRSAAPRLSRERSHGTLRPLVMTLHIYTHQLPLLQSSQ